MSIISGLTWAQAPTLSTDCSPGLLGPFTVERGGGRGGEEGGREGKGEERRGGEGGEGRRGGERRGEEGGR